MIAKDLRFAVIGCGYWGPKIARNLDSLPHAAVTMMADTDANRIASLKLNQPWIQATTDAGDIFRSDVDGVVIATPVRTHYKLARAALLHGKHVLVEKPLTANVQEAQELVNLAAEHKRILMVGHTFEYNPGVIELRKLIQSGDLGRIYSIEAERLNLGLFRNDIDVIWDLAPHDISILLYLLGENPTHIEAMAHAHLRPHVYDTAFLNLGFPGGTTARVHVSWLDPCKTRKVT